MAITGNTIIDDAQSDKRTLMASEYIRGEGIEIGALHQPLNVPMNVYVHYVDRLTKDEIKSHYPELNQVGIVETDIIDDAQTLDKIDDEKFDFCIANHVLEHMKDPIGSLINWLRILKAGGILYLSIPDVSNPLDNGRSVSTLEHFIEDHSSPDGRRDYTHYVECAKYWNNLSDETEIERIATINMKMNYSIHFHTFNKDLIERALYYLSTIEGTSFRVIDSAENKINGVKEFIYILEKDISLDKVTYLLDSRNANDDTKINITLDIVVPIYNAYDDLLKCLYSIMRYHEFSRIILIDDRSTDSRIKKLFSALGKYTDYIVLLENEQNLGFVKTVNKGMKYSNNDVVLLNSDTIVTEGWEHKIHKCAYSDKKIATVTPFTNNGTICSIPNFKESNKIPEGLTIEGFAKLVESVSFQQYPEIPTAVGFCMYIKRDIINCIGYFNEEVFGKGYGEENDFCMRVVKNGYINVLCDDTFIYHKGSQSFSAEKEVLSRKNTELLAQMHPEYLPMVSRFCLDNPLKELQLNIVYQMATYAGYSNKKNVLYVIHHLGGGTEKHVYDLIRILGKQYNFFIVKVENNKIVLEEHNNDTKILYTFPLAAQLNLFKFRDENYSDILGKILDTFKIDLIHIHHLLGHTLDVFDLGKKRNIPIIFTIHDYYIVCPKINLIDYTGSYCHEYNNLEKCSRCISETFSVSEDCLNQWRSSFRNALNKCSLIIAPSYSVYNTLSKYYDISCYDHIVIGHGHEDKMLRNDRYSEYNNGQQFHIAYIGVLTINKGREIFYKLAGSKLLKNRVKWSIIGTSDLHSKKGFYGDYNITVYGAYDGYNELKSIIDKEGVNLAIFPSIVQESFSFTLSEAWGAGIPAIVSNLGALKERTESTGAGWVVDMSDIQNVEKIIKEIIESPVEYEKKINAVKAVSLKSFNSMKKEYEEVYNKNINLYKQVYDSESTFSNYDLFNHLIKINQYDISTGIQFAMNNEPNATNILYIKFFKCLNENGLRYTLNRIIVYLRNNI